MTPLPNTSGNPIADSAPAQTDDTERATREKLSLREAQLSQAQQMAGMASWEWYFGDTQIQWSPEMYMFWGYDPDEITVNLDSVAQSTHLDDLPILQGAIARVLQGDDLEVEYRRYNKAGREIFIHTIGRIIRNEAGEPIGVFGIDLNITKRKHQENELRRLNDVLELKNRELEQRNAELNSFSYVANHDLQEPLRKIQSFNSLILERESDCLTESAKDYFGRSMAAAGRMQELIKDLIDYSRVNAANWAFESIDLNRLLNEVKHDLNELITGKEAVIHTSTLPTTPVIEFMFRQLLQNLISNSLKYHRPGVSPIIRVNYQRIEPDYTTPKSSDLMHQLTVSDNGIGFDPAYSQRIFQLFQRLHGRSQYTGTGIGLAICHRIMQNHNGTILAEAVPNQGATFTMRWPVA